jgi:hypothetical protein
MNCIDFEENLNNLLALKKEAQEIYCTYSKVSLRKLKKKLNNFFFVFLLFFSLLCFFLYKKENLTINKIIQSLGLYIK